MEARVTYKDVEVEGAMYRIKKMDPRLACYVFATLAAKAEENILDAFGHCTREQFDELQGYALKNVDRLEQGEGMLVPIGIMGPNGMWADKNLESDPKAVLNLTTLCLLFNIQPFLGDNKSTVPSSNQGA